MTKQEFLDFITKERKANRDKWISGYFTVGNKEVGVKSFNTSIQVFTVNGIKQGSFWDLSVKEFNKIILEGIN